MFLRQTIELEQKQQLVMTQELRQSIDLLQYNTLELTEYINKEILENPMLELKEEGSRINWKEYFKKDQVERIGTYPYSDDTDYSINNLIKYEESLYEYLKNQLILTKTSKREYIICDYIIKNINSNGYLDIDLESICKKFKASKEFVESCLEIVQSFDPVGVGSKDLKECLNIQLNYLNLNDRFLKIIIDNHLKDIAKNNIKKISKELGLSIKQTQKYVSIISSLIPNPGNMFKDPNAKIKYTSPDAYIVEINGKLEIIIDDGLSNRLNINSYYKNLLLSSKDNSVTNFLEERLNRAFWLIKSIEKRRQTMIKVLNSIIKYQNEFFYTNSNKINPLTLKEVANDIGMHESTVSRVTSNKYIETKKGLFNLKYFFNSKIGQSNISSLDIKNEIILIIENENKKQPYSDQAIADIFKNRDIKISRRTIAKYREELDIPSSAIRKKY